MSVAYFRLIVVWIHRYTGRISRMNRLMSFLIFLLISINIIQTCVRRHTERAFINSDTYTHSYINDQQHIWDD